MDEVFNTEVRQSSIDRDLGRQGHPDYTFRYPVAGVIVAVHYPGEDGCGNEFRYDVDVTSLPIPRRLKVPRLAQMAGLDDGDDDVLRALSETDSGKAAVKDGGGKIAPTLRSLSDGDRVILLFINGNVGLPVIAGVLPNAKTKRATWKDVRGNELPKKGELVRRKIHKGTEIIQDGDGNVKVDFGPRPKDNSEKKKLTIHIGDFDIVIDNTVNPTALTITHPNGPALAITKNGLTINSDKNRTPVKTLLGETFTNSHKNMVDGDKNGWSDLQTALGNLNTALISLATGLGSATANLTSGKVLAVDAVTAATNAATAANDAATAAGKGAVAQINFQQDWDETNGFLSPKNKSD